MGMIRIILAGLRQRKKLFIGLAFLMFVITALGAATINTGRGITESVINTITEDVPYDCFCFARESVVTDEAVEELCQLENVEMVNIISEIGVNVEGFINGLFVRKADSSTKIMNANMDGWLEKQPEFKDGEIYISQSMSATQGWEIGDTVTLTPSSSNNYTFKIAGYCLDSIFGSYVVGSKQFFISDNDYEKIYRDAESMGENNTIYSQVLVRKTEDCEMSQIKFLNYLNENSRIFASEQALVSSAVSTFCDYTTLIVDIIIDVMAAFSILLLVIMIIILGHNIRTGIELDYKDLGILKAQGASSRYLRTEICAQYFCALLIGAVLGIAASAFLARWFGSLFQVFTAIPAKINVDWGIVLLLVFAVLVLTVIMIILFTGKINKISPVSAISGGKGDIHFKSKLQLPISGKALSFTITLRQFTSNIGSYIGAIVIVAILTFTMLLVNTLDDSLNSRSALRGMGNYIPDLMVTFEKAPDDETLMEADRIVGETSDFQRMIMSNQYLLINGEKTACLIFDDECEIVCYKGRAPIYDNEIAITEILSEIMDIDVGDEVTVENGDKKIDCIVTGFTQTQNDAGKCFVIRLNTASRLGYGKPRTYQYILENPEKRDEAGEMLTNYFSEDEATVTVVDESAILGQYGVILKALRAMLYIASILIALITSFMTCSKLLLLEKKNLGIYRAMGFSNTHLRVQFALRFLVSSVIGVIIGLILNLLLSDFMCSILLRSVGFTHFLSEHTFASTVIPFVVVMAGFFLFAFLTSGRVKRIEVRELISE